MSSQSTDISHKVIQGDDKNMLENLKKQSSISGNIHVRIMVHNNFKQTLTYLSNSQIVRLVSRRSINQSSWIPNCIGFLYKNAQKLLEVSVCSILLCMHKSVVFSKLGLI